MRIWAAAAVVVLAAGVVYGATPDYWETVWGYAGGVGAGDLVQAILVGTGEKVGEAVVKAEGGQAGYNMVLFSADGTSREVCFAVKGKRIGGSLMTKPEELGLGVRRFDLGAKGPDPDPAPEPAPAAASAVTLSVSDAEVTSGAETFDLGLAVSEAVAGPCDLYILVETPTGILTINLDGSTAPGIAPAAENLAGHSAPLPFDLSIWTDLAVGAGLAGDYRFVLVVTNAGQVPPVSSLDEVKLDSANVIAYDAVDVSVL